MALSSIVLKSLVAPAALAGAFAWLGGPSIAALLTGAAGATLGFMGWQLRRRNAEIDQLIEQRDEMFFKTIALERQQKRLKTRAKAMVAKARKQALAQGATNTPRPLPDYGVLLAGAGFGVIETDARWRVIKASPVAARAFGFDDADMMASVVGNLPEELLAGPEAITHGATAAKEGWITCNGLDHSPAEGKALSIAVKPRAGGGWMLLVEDITARNGAHDLLAQAEQQLADAHRTRAEFMQHVSHELRTPLNQILGFADVMIKQPYAVSDPDSLADYASEIHNSGLKLLGMIEAVMEINRIEAGIRRVNDAPVDLNRCLKRQIEEYRNRADVRGIRFGVKLAADLPILKAEEKALREMVDHLVWNAFAATAEGGEIRLAVDVAPDGAVTLSVTDSGYGISHEDQARALSPFGKVASPLSQLVDGAGLGLNIVQALAQMHQASFTLDSVEGKGTIVTLTFPATRSIIRRAA